MHYISVYFSGCGQLMPVQTSLVHMTNRNSMACHITSDLAPKGRLCNSDLSRLNLSVNIANPCSKLLCTEVREVY